MVAQRIETQNMAERFSGVDVLAFGSMPAQLRGPSPPAIPGSSALVEIQGSEGGIRLTHQAWTIQSSDV
jgi:hypothetical protein